MMVDAPPSYHPGPSISFVRGPAYRYRGTDKPAPSIQYDGGERLVAVYQHR